MKPAEGSTVIGKSVIIRGELSGKEDLYIDGDVEGTVTLPDSRLTIGPNAQVRADVNAQEVVIFGSLTGNISSSGRVDLRQSAVVKGDILAGRLSIEESAVLSGRVELKSACRRREAFSSGYCLRARCCTVPVAVSAPVPSSASLFLNQRLRSEREAGGCLAVSAVAIVQVVPKASQVVCLATPADGMSY